jgi:myo-inositol-1(or 4)-monophosphatase
VGARVVSPDRMQERFEFGSTLIEEAGALAMGFFERLDSLTVTHKGVQDVASEADLETELLIRERLAQRFPEDAFLGEETGRGDVDGSTGMWIVDPIDGTLPFVKGMGAWCVSIAYVLDGVFELGFIVAPARDELFIGRRGRGATLNGKPISVAADARLDDGIVGVGYSPRVGADDLLPILEPLLRAGAMFYREGSGALGLCYLACGRLIGYVENHINSWDCAAAIAIVHAAGGVTNDFLAGDGLWSGGPLIAGPPALYPSLEAVFENNG